MRIVHMLLATLALAVLAGTVSAAGEGEKSAAQAVKDLKKQGNQVVKDFKNQLLGKGGIIYQFCHTVDNAEKQVKDGELTADQAMDQVAAASSSASRSAQAAVDSAFDAIESAADSLLACVPAQVAIPGGFAPGDCGVLDQLDAKMGVVYEKARGKALKKLKKYGKKVEKSAGFDMGSIITAIVQALGIAPAAGGGNPAPAIKPTTVDWRSGGNFTDTPSDGKLCTGGSADPANGATVTVVITDENGNDTTQTNIPITGCKWDVCFPPTGAGNLPEGNYRITVTHGTQSVTSTIGV